MGQFIIKQYNKNDYKKLFNGHKFCFIDDACYLTNNEINAEIIIRDVIKYDKINNTIEYFDNNKGFGYDQSITLNQESQNILNLLENRLNNKYYFILSVNDDEKEFLRFIESRYFYMYLKHVLGNNKLTWYNLEHFSHQYIPDVFCKSSVDESLKLMEKNYGDDIRFKRTDIKSNWALILSIISTLLGIIGLFK